VAAPAVTVRFYGALNDFLPRARRGVRFAHHLRAPASVKDTIEAIGVPHPEVDLILLNGDPVDFSALVSGDDDLSVYPRFVGIELDAVTHVGEMPADATRFALDVHLSKLASWLRLAGFDVVVIADDAELAKSGGEDARIVLTRDVALLKRGIVRYGAWIRSTDPEWQLAEVLQRFDLAPAVSPFTRCMQCNSPLVTADAAAVSDRLPPRTRERFSNFRECSGCGRVYWQGSHYPRLCAALELAVSRAGSGRPTAGQFATGRLP
jgi:uncharacterized protein with PIN domain